MKIEEIKALDAEIKPPRAGVVLVETPQGIRLAEVDPKREDGSKFWLPGGRTLSQSFGWYTEVLRYAYIDEPAAEDAPLTMPSGVYVDLARDPY